MTHTSRPRRWTRNRRPDDSIWSSRFEKERLASVADTRFSRLVSDFRAMNLILDPWCLPVKSHNGCALRWEAAARSGGPDRERGSAAALGSIMTAQGGDLERKQSGGREDPVGTVGEHRGAADHGVRPGVAAGRARRHRRAAAGRVRHRVRRFGTRRGSQVPQRQSDPAGPGRGLLGRRRRSGSREPLRKPPQTVVIGPRNDTRTATLATAAWRTFRPGRLVAIYDPANVVLDSLPETVAGAARVFRGDPTPRAYVCVGETCAPPTTDDATVRELVRRYGLRGWR